MPPRPWQLAISPTGLATPADLQVLPALQWLDAPTGGSVAQILKNAGLWNDQAAETLAHSDCWYRCQLPAQSARQLCFEGIAGAAEIWLDTQLLARHTTMYRPLQVSLPSIGEEGAMLYVSLRTQQSWAQKRQGRARWRPRMVQPGSMREVRQTLLGHMPGWCPEVPALGLYGAVSVVSAEASADPRVVRLVADWTHDGAVLSWGTCENLSLGHGPDVKVVQRPRRIEALDGIRITHIAAGETACAAVSDEGDVYTWGWGGSFWQGNGGLGHGDNTSQPRPALVQHLEEAHVRVATVSVGSGHMLAVTRDGKVLSWGNGEYGRCGNGRRKQLVPAPVELLAAHTCVAVAAGFQHSLALTDGGVVYAWGKNDAGQLGQVRARGGWVRAGPGGCEPSARWRRVVALRSVSRDAVHPRVSISTAPHQGGTMVMDLNTMEEYPLPVMLEGDDAVSARDFSAWWGRQRVVV